MKLTTQQTGVKWVKTKTGGAYLDANYKIRYEICKQCNADVTYLQNFTKVFVKRKKNNG